MGETLVYIVFPETENCEQSPSANLMALKQQDEINADVLMQLFTTLEKNLSFFEYEHFVPVYNNQNLRATLCSLKATMPMAFPNQQMLFLTMLKQRSVDITGITTRDLECKYKLYHQDVTTTILGDMANCLYAVLGQHLCHIVHYVRLYCCAVPNPLTVAMYMSVPMLPTSRPKL